MSFSISRLLLKQAFYEVWNFKEASFATPMRLDSIITKYECGRHADFWKGNRKFTNLNRSLRAQSPSLTYVLLEKTLKTWYGCDLARKGIKRENAEENVHCASFIIKALTGNFCC